jgi:hypothetical protein
MAYYIGLFYRYNRTQLHRDSIISIQFDLHGQKTGYRHVDLGQFCRMRSTHRSPLVHQLMPRLDSVLVDTPGVYSLSL